MVNHIPYEFYQPYLDILPDDGSSLEELLESSLSDFLSLTRGISQEKEGFAYQQAKWTIKQLVQHMIDAERVFAYRAMRFVRGDQTVLSGFDENAFADAAPTPRDFRLCVRLPDNCVTPEPPWNST